MKGKNNGQIKSSKKLIIHCWYTGNTCKEVELYKNNKALNNYNLSFLLTFLLQAFIKIPHDQDSKNVDEGKNQ